MAALEKQDSQLADRDQNPLIGERQDAISDIAETGTAEDGDARAKLNVVLAALRSHGLIAES